MVIFFYEWILEKILDLCHQASTLSEPTKANFKKRGRSWNDLENCCRKDSMWQLWERLHPDEIRTLRQYMLEIIQDVGIASEIEQIRRLPWSYARWECTGNCDGKCWKRMQIMDNGNEWHHGLWRDCKLSTVGSSASSPRPTLAMYCCRTGIPLSLEDWETHLRCVQNDSKLTAQFWIEQRIVSPELAYRILEFCFGPRLPRLPRLPRANSPHCRVRS